MHPEETPGRAPTLCDRLSSESTPTLYASPPRYSFPQEVRAEILALCELHEKIAGRPPWA